MSEVSEELLNNVNFLCTIFNNLNNPTVVINSSGVVIKASDSVKKDFLKYENLDLVGLNITEFADQWLVDIIFNCDSATISDVTGQDRYYFHIISNKFNYDNQKYYIVTVEDVTEKEKLIRLLEQALEIATKTIRITR